MKCEEAHYYKKVSELMCFFNEYVPWVEEAHLQITRYKAFTFTLQVYKRNMVGSDN
jgi:hypothetical protein